jgi:hypothetical protein
MGSNAEHPTPLSVVRVANVQSLPLLEPSWLIEGLWGRDAVGIIGGAPKSCKSFLALEIALAVASGHPCLGHFSTPQPGPVILYAAEDSPVQVRTRLEGLASARNVDFHDLPIHLVLDSDLRLDLSKDQLRLKDAIQRIKPRLLILDPFVRIHRLDENSAQEVSALLADLRAWQRQFDLAILLVHHARKTAAEVTGLSLRGSSDLHAWGDSNLYLSRHKDKLTLAMEHRCAPSGKTVSLTLATDHRPPRLELRAPSHPAPDRDVPASVLEILRQSKSPLPQASLRSSLKMRNQRLGLVLRELQQAGLVTCGLGGWTATNGSP